MDKPEMVEILDIVQETPSHKTFKLDVELDARPGQFCMLWIPRVNEKPMSISNVEGNIEITVKKVGSFTSRMFLMQPGDKIGLRGPYGHGFELVPGRVCIVGGGCGIAPLKPLVKKLSGSAVISARTKDEIMFQEHFEKNGFDVSIATDDGSQGLRGFAHEAFGSLISRENFNAVYVCGPEPMMAKVYDLCEKESIPAQLSLERYMKCGVGICGSCSLSGLRVCKEGPVFTIEQLKQTDFGRFTRDATGSKRKNDGC